MYAMCFEVMVQRQWINNPLVPSVTFLRHCKKCRSRSDAAEGRHCLLFIQKVKTLMSEAPFFFFFFLFLFFFWFFLMLLLFIFLLSASPRMRIIRTFAHWHLSLTSPMIIRY